MSIQSDILAFLFIAVDSQRLLTVGTEAAMVCGWMRVYTMVQHATVQRTTTKF